MQDKNFGKKAKNIAISFIALASMILTGCATLFGGTIQSGTDINGAFGPYEKAVNFVQSTRGKIDVRLNFDGEYEGSKYASSYPDAFYISPELSNSTDDLEYFQFLYMLDDKYTVYCYQTHKYKNGKKRSDGVKTSKDTTEDAYIMYPEVVIDEKYEVDPNYLYTVFAVYDYTAGNKSGYKELGRWQCKTDDPAAFCFSKLGYSENGSGTVGPQNITICTNNHVYNYNCSDLWNYIRGANVPPPNYLNVDLKVAFQYFLDSPDNQKTSTSTARIIDPNKPYELEVYNVACKTDKNGTYIYLDMTASTSDGGDLLNEDGKSIEEEYYSDDPTADAPTSEYDDMDDDDEGDEENEDLKEPTAEEEAEAQAATGSFDFICCIVDCSVGTLRVYSGPTPDDGKYQVEFYNGVKSNINTLYSHIMNNPKFNKYYKMADYDGNAPFIAMAIYETFDVCGYTYTGEDEDGDPHTLSELEWKQLMNEYYDDDEDYEDEYVVAYSAELEYHDYLNSLTGQVSYYNPATGTYLYGDKMGITKRDPVPIGGIKYSQTGARQNKVKEFPVTLYGQWRAWDTPYFTAKRRVMGRKEVDNMEFDYNNAVLEAVAFTNISASENSFETLGDDTIIGWDGNTIYNKPQSISSIYYLPESFSEIYKKNYNGATQYSYPSWKEGRDPYGYTNVTAAPTVIVSGLKEVNYLVTDNGPYVLAVKDGEVLATPGSSGYDAKNNVKILTKNFTQTVSEATENRLKINTELSGSSSAYWNKQDEISDSNFAVDSSYKNGVTAGVFNIFLNAEQGSTAFEDVKKELRAGNDEDASLTCIIGSDGVHFAKANGADLTDTLSYDDIDKLLDPTKADAATLRDLLKSDVLIQNWNNGAKISELVRENLRYRYLISFTAKADDSVTINISEAKVGSVTTAKSFSVKPPKAGSDQTIESQVDKKNKEYSKYFGIDYWNSIRQYILDSVQVDKHVYTKYKKVRNSNYNVIGAENLDLKKGNFDGSKTNKEWWLCTTALYGLGFQDYSNPDEFFIPTFQRVQHMLNTTSVYDENDDLKDTTSELETSTVALKNGIACYGIYNNVLAKKDKEKSTTGDIEYPYVFIGFDNQGNVYTEAEICRAKVIPFGYSGENFSKTVSSGNQKLTLDVKKTGDDKVIYYLKDSFVNKSGQEIIVNPRDAEDRDALLDKITGRIHGYVNDLDGNGVEDITATLTGPLEGTAYTYSEGKFQFRRLVQGTYILNESIEGVDIATFQVIVGENGKIENIYTDDVYKCEAKTEFKGNDAYIYLTGFEGVDEIDKISGRVLGYIYNEKGDGVKKVTAKIDGPVQAEAVTQDGGSFSVRRLTEGLYTVTEIYNKVEIATFEVKIGPTGEIENIDTIDYYNCEPDTLIQGKTARLTLNNFKGAKYSEDAFTGRIISKITDGKGIPIKGITTSVTGAVTASANTGNDGRSTIKKLDKGVYYVSESYGESTIATYKVVVGPRGKINSIEVLSYVDCSTTTSVDGNEAYIEITGDPNISDWPKGRGGGDPGKKPTGDKDKKSISHNDRKKKTTPKDTREVRDPSEIIDEFLGDRSGNDTSGNERIVRHKDPNDKSYTGDVYERKPTGANGGSGPKSFWEWILGHLALIGPLLIIILIAIGYAIYKMMKGKKLGFERKKKGDRKSPFAWITKYFKPM